MEVGATILTVGIGFMSIILILTIVVLIWYSGLLDSVTVGAGTPPCGLLKVMYKFGRGPYKTVGEFFTEVTCLAPEHRCFGVYYDDPKQVVAEKLRWVVGCILSEGQEEVDTVLMKRFEDEGYKSYYFPAVNNAVKTSFPYRSMLSVLVGVYRVYPAMASYIRKMKLCAHPFIEVYAGNVIHYYAPMSKQEYFYVPEADPDFVDQKLISHGQARTTSDQPTVCDDPGEGGSGLVKSDKPDDPEERVIPVTTKHAATKPIDGNPDQAVPKPATPQRQNSAQIVPEMKKSRDSESQNSEKIAKETVLVKNVDQECVVPDTSTDCKEKSNSCAQRKAKSLCRLSGKESELNESDQAKLKANEMRSKSVSVKKTRIFGQQGDVNNSLDQTGQSKPLDVQDSGVTSTVYESTVLSSEGDSFSDLEKSPESSYNLQSGSNLDQSTDQSYSYSYSGSSYNTMSGESQGTFSQSSDFVDRSTSAAGLVELSSDSDGETRSIPTTPVNSK